MRPAARVSRKTAMSSSRSVGPGSPIISRSPTRSTRSLIGRECTVDPAGSCKMKWRSPSGGNTMKAIALVLVVAVLAWPVLPAGAADDTKVKEATRSVETGAKKIGDGQVGQGVEDTAKGIGKTVVEGAK